MVMMSLSGTQEITLKIRESIYYGQLKIMYQTFSKNRHASIFYDNKWYPVHLLMNEVQPRNLLEIEVEIIPNSQKTKVICDELLTFISLSSEITAKNLKPGDMIKINTMPVKNIYSHSDEYVKVLSINKQQETTSWLFGIECDEIPELILTNGIIVK